MKIIFQRRKRIYNAHTLNANPLCIVFASVFVIKWENNHSELWIIKKRSILFISCTLNGVGEAKGEKVNEKKNEPCSHWKIKFSSQVFLLRAIRTGFSSLFPLEHKWFFSISASLVSVDLVVWKMLCKLSTHLQ